MNIDQLEEQDPDETSCRKFFDMSEKHLDLLLNELSFSWSNRDPKKTISKNGKKKIVWTPKSIIEQPKALLPYAHSTQIRCTINGRIRLI